jgi:PRC-barrel domain
MSKCYLAGTVLAAALMAAPGLAMAQNNNGHSNNNGNTAGLSNNVGNIGYGGYSGRPMPLPNNNNNNSNNSNASNQRPSQRNPLLADNGDVRASKFIGTTIHNDRDQNIGSVSDVLIGRNGVWAIVSTNNKKVAVPFQNFVLGDSNARGDDKLVLPNATQAQLNTLPVFHYNETNYANNGNSNGNSGWYSNNNSQNNNGRGLFGNGTIRNNGNNG